MGSEQDPFFTPWNKILEGIFESEDLLHDIQGSIGVEMQFQQLTLGEQQDGQARRPTNDAAILAAVYGRLTDIRASYGAIVTQMDGLLDGIEAIENSDPRSFKPDYTNDDIPSRVTMARTIARQRWVARLEDDSF